MLPLGTIAPAFTLYDTLSGKELHFHELKSNIATVVMFLCNHCPYVKHIQSEIVTLAKRYQSKGIAFIAISSNDVTNYPEDSPQKMKQTAFNLGFTFPYLYDETQAVAKAYQAACTPDFYVFNKALQCIYRGQFDDSRPGNEIPVTGASLAEALDAVLTGKVIDSEQKPSIGCNIKWKMK